MRTKLPLLAILGLGLAGCGGGGGGAGSETTTTTSPTFPNGVWEMTGDGIYYPDTDTSRTVVGKMIVDDRELVEYYIFDDDGCYSKFANTWKNDEKYTAFTEVDYTVTLTELENGNLTMHVYVTDANLYSTKSYTYLEPATNTSEAELDAEVYPQCGVESTVPAEFRRS